MTKDIENWEAPTVKDLGSAEDLIQGQNNHLKNS